MPTASEPRLEDIARIAFVTRRFHELQGLQQVVFGASLIVGAVVAHTMPAGYPGLMFQAWNFPNLSFALAAVFLQRMYRQTFGHAVGTSRQQLLAGTPILLMMLGGMIDMFVPIGRPAPSLAALALTSCSIWILFRDWRWRIHYVVAATAGIIAALITASAPPLPRILGSHRPGSHHGIPPVLLDSWSGDGLCRAARSPLAGLVTATALFEGVRCPACARTSGLGRHACRLVRDVLPDDRRSTLDRESDSDRSPAVSAADRVGAPLRDACRLCFKFQEP